MVFICLFDSSNTLVVLSSPTKPTIVIDIRKIKIFEIIIKSDPCLLVIKKQVVLTHIADNSIMIDISKLSRTILISLYINVIVNIYVNCYVVFILSFKSCA